MPEGKTPIAPFAEAVRERYRFEREIGAGGMATVFLATDLKHDRPVAIKVLRNGETAVDAERFHREIRVLARLRHPFILPLHDSGEAGGALFFVMPFVDGESLRSRLTREERLPVADALELAREVADALRPDQPLELPRYLPCDVARGARGADGRRPGSRAGAPGAVGLDVQPRHPAFAQEPQRRPGVRGSRREASAAALTV